MDRQIGQLGQQPSVLALEERVRVLENRVAALYDMIRIMARGLEDLPTGEPGQRPAAEAARRAYDLCSLQSRGRASPRRAWTAQRRDGYRGTRRWPWRHDQCPAPTLKQPRLLAPDGAVRVSGVRTRGAIRSANFCPAQRAGS